MPKKKTKHKFGGHRNAAPPRPRASKAEPETAMQRLAMTAAGAGGTALLGGFLNRQGWAPKTIAGALGVLGAGLAWKGDGETIKSVGAGTMAAAGGQLAMLLIDDHSHAPVTVATAPTFVKKPANVEGLPPGALESAFERARERFALVGGDHHSE